MRACAILAALFAATLVVAQDKDKPAVREIPTKDLKLTFPQKGKATEPAVVTSADDLAKNEVVGRAADEIKKQIDFGKEKLVVFAWGGSGQDKISGEVKTADKKATAVFTYTRGLTRDFRQHIHLFVVPKDAEVKVETAK
jgi:hypothetical protein